MEGTPGYMAPEIHNKDGYEGATVDLFALGVILYIMRTRQEPFKVAMTSDMKFR